MLSKSFKPAKCKTSLKLAVARIKLLRNKREVQLKQLRRELAQLLESGQDQTARIRVEHVIREEKTMSAYELIELYCELLAARLPIIESQKSCPIDLKEAVSSVIFASPRCADVPELADIRKHFAAKYGKDFINSSLEVRPDCGVSRMVVEKLSARSPDIETKVKTLTSIAQEHNVKWDSKSLEEQLHKSHDDLVNVPTAFASPSRDPMESANVTSSHAPTRTNESSMKMPQNDPATTRTPGNAVLWTSQSERSPSERRSIGGEVDHSKPREENASLNRPTFRMEFQNATAAAQAAAESAARARMAARAAAEIASHENMSSLNYSRSDESPMHSKKYERPEKLRALLGDQTVEESVPKANNELKSLQGTKAEMQNLQNDEIVQGVPRREDGKTSNDYSIQHFITDDIFDVNIPKVDVNAQSMSSESETAEPNPLYMEYQHVESSRENINVKSSKVTSSPYVTDDEKLWDSNVYKHDKDEGETSRMYAGETTFGSNHWQSFSNDSFAAVFDNYGSNADDNNSIFERSSGRLLDAYGGEESSIFQSNKGPFTDQSRIESFSKSSSSQLHLFTEHSETTTEGTLPSPSDDSIPPAFDDSDGESSENENEVANSVHKEPMRPSHILHDHRHSTNSLSDDVTHESNHNYLREISEVKETADKLNKRSDTDQSNSVTSLGDPGYRSTDEDEQLPLHSTKRLPTRESETKEKSKTPSMHMGTEGSEVLNEFGEESEQEINLGRLTGGFRHKNFPCPPHVRSSLAVASSSSKQNLDATSITKKPVVSDMYKQSVSSEVLAESDKSTAFHSNKKFESSKVLLEQRDRTSRTKSYKESSTKIASLGSDDRVEKLDLNYTAGRRVNETVKLSRRTRDVPSESKSSSTNVTNPLPNTTYDAVTIQVKGSSDSIQSTPSAPSVIPTKISSTFENSSKLSQLNPMNNIAPTNNTNSSGPSGETASSESSLKKASHTHPKLPNYESFAAHFHSLRSNRQ